jgi:uncharacterized protein (TIGR04551 family)
MRSCYWIFLLIALSWSASALGQSQPPAVEPPPNVEAPGAEPAPPAPEAAAPAAPETEAVPGPQPEAPAPAAPPPPDAAPGGASGTPAPVVPSPAEMENLLNEQLASTPGTNHDWTAPAPVFTLHGYMRVRGELLDTFWLGRRALTTAEKGVQGPDPFTRFRPLESRNPPSEGCVGQDTNPGGTCDVGALSFANMRLRLSPELALSEDVRVKMSFDVFDNVILGDQPTTYYGKELPRSEGAPMDNFTGVESVFASGVHSTSDVIKPRRAWAEVRNRNLGELRFGRMPQSWGLGMYYNAGDGLDDDLSSDLDRVVGITKLMGFYLSASYDFIGEGFFERNDERPLEQSQLDDVDQFTFSAALRSTPEELAAAKERGEMTFNAGLQFALRNQDSIYSPTAAGMPAPGTMDYPNAPLRTIDATHYTTDLWLMLRYRGLRIEGEVAWVAGSMDNLTATGGANEYTISQVGYALETELRLVDDKLGLYFDHGLASGDSSTEGLSSGSGGLPTDTADFVSQGSGDDTVSTFRFHPSYRVDLILWRNLMRQVTGAYYFKPGISYDFVRSPFGQVAGARLDVIYSRAVAPIQTWGNDADLGLEIDVSLYFRTDDGPDLDDGFNAKLQYGVLFPMAGLNLLAADPAMPKPGDLHTAQTLRLLLGVVF